ncbi:hypothetical protein D3C85_1056880 [compost metagenome]
MQGVEQHLPHRLRPQHPGVVGLVHQIDQSLGGTEHFFGQGDRVHTAFLHSRGGQGIPQLQQQFLQGGDVDLQGEADEGLLGGGEALALAGQRQCHQQVVAGVVAKHLIRQIAHLVSLQYDDHPGLVEHGRAAVILGGVDEVHLLHRGGGDARGGDVAGQPGGEIGVTVGHGRSGWILMICRNRQAMCRMLP